MCPSEHAEAGSSFSRCRGNSWTSGEAVLSPLLALKPGIKAWPKPGNARITSPGERLPPLLVSVGINNVPVQRSIKSQLFLLPIPSPSVSSTWRFFLALTKSPTCLGTSSDLNSMLYPKTAATSGQQISFFWLSSHQKQPGLGS